MNIYINVVLISFVTLLSIKCNAEIQPYTNPNSYNLTIDFDSAKNNNVFYYSQPAKRHNPLESYQPR